MVFVSLLPSWMSLLSGSESEESDTDLDLKLLQRLQRIEGRETAQTEEEKPVSEKDLVGFSRLVNN